MSEYFYGSFDSDSESEDNQSHSFSFLENAKLVGETPTGLRIYLEDYVYTYLYQYAKLYRGQEKCAALVGSYTENLDEMSAIISGALQVNEIESEEGNMLSETHIEEIQKQIERYFPNSQLMGWMHTQPGYGIFLTTHDMKIQQTLFKEPYQTLMIIDPIENTDAFFAWHLEEIESVEGYYIYYNKNEEMQNYMVSNKVSVSNEEFNDREDVVMHFRKKDRAKKQEIQNKKIAHLVTALSLVLFLMCVTMAIGLIQHRERLAKLESELNNMGSNYDNLLSQLNQENLQVVFAEEDLEKNEVSKVDKNHEDSSVTEAFVEDAEVESPTEEKVNNEETVVLEEEKEEFDEVDFYTVKKGDNLIRICYQHYKTTNALGKVVEINNLESPNKIYEGQVLKLPRLQ